MNTQASPIKLTTLIIIFPFVTLLLYGALSYFSFFNAQQKNIQNDLEQYEKSFIEAEQKNLKEKVENLTQFIRYYDGTNSSKIKNDVKTIINVSADIANNIYHKYKDTVDEETLKEMLLSALSGIKFEGDIGYLFSLNLKGDVLLHIDPVLVGKNLLNIQDINGKYFIKEFNKAVTTKGEGFVDYYWNIITEDKNTAHYKISFVKKLDAYDWYIGAGEYLKYMTRYTRSDILKYIKANATFNNGYIFVSDSLNNIVFYPDDKQLNEEENKRLSHYRIEGIYEDDYQLAYTLYVAQYDWYVTAVKDLKTIQTNIDKQKASNKEKRTKDLTTNLLLMGGIWLISLLLSVYLSTIINRMLRNYDRRIKDTNEKLIFQSRQALIGELFPMIAHQWRQPINKIASILALLRFELLDKKISLKEVDERCHNIEENIEFMSETIDDFRTFYQPKEHSASVNIKDLVNKSLDFLEGSLCKKDIQIVKELENIEFKLYGNEFLQVMINLIKNAVDSSAPKGLIIVKLYKIQTGNIIISVEDNGAGIEDKKALEKIFDPYYTTKKDSMGLGLYMTKMIVEKHMNGTIEAIQLSQGLRFTINLSPQ